MVGTVEPSKEFLPIKINDQILVRLLNVNMYIKFFLDPIFYTKNFMYQKKKKMDIFFIDYDRIITLYVKFLSTCTCRFRLAFTRIY